MTSQNQVRPAGYPAPAPVTDSEYAGAYLRTGSCGCHRGRRAARLACRMDLRPGNIRARPHDRRAGSFSGYEPPTLRAASSTDHGPTVLRVCRAVLGPDDAEDAWSETFLAAMQAYPRLRPDSDVVGLAGDHRPPQGHRPGSRRASRRAITVPELPDRPATPTETGWDDSTGSLGRPAGAAPQAAPDRRLPLPRRHALPRDRRHRGRQRGRRATCGRRRHRGPAHEHRPRRSPHDDHRPVPRPADR